MADLPQKPAPPTFPAVGPAPVFDEEAKKKLAELNKRGHCFPVYGAPPAAEKPEKPAEG